MKNKSPDVLFIGQLEHRPKKKLGQQGAEFFHKKKEVRKHLPGGFRGKRAKHADG